MVAAAGYKELVINTAGAIIVMMEVLLCSLESLTKVK